MRAAPALVLLGALAAGPVACASAGSGSAVAPLVRIGSKSFTESVILGELAVLLARSAGAATDHRRQLGGTRVVWNALLSGEIDIYPEYSGTISEEILAGAELRGYREVVDALEAYGVRAVGPLGFNNTYALGMSEDVAERFGIRTVSDLRRHPELRFGFSNEFLDRGDGWPSLAERYGLQQANVTGLDHDLAYRGLAAGSIDVIDLYSTDAEIRFYGLRALDDDLGHFPAYEAMLLYRADLEERVPGVLQALSRLEGAISKSDMIGMNASAKIDRAPEEVVAAEFLSDALETEVEVTVTGWLGRLVEHLSAHLFLVTISLFAAIVTAVPLGIAAARRPRMGQLILSIVGVIQTVPSLALLVVFVPLLGLGALPAIAALFLYSLLPIVRNTHAGLHDIPADIIDSARALGLPGGARLRLVELPMAARAILAGIKTSAVINVGTATLGALIGAGGFGQPILTGIRLADTGLILQGAIPAALLALSVQGFFEAIERWLVPRGLRLQPAR